MQIDKNTLVNEAQRECFLTNCSPSGQNGKLLFPVFLPDGHAKTTGEWQVKDLSSSLTVIKKLPERLPSAKFYLRMLFQPYSECCSQFENA